MRIPARILAFGLASAFVVASGGCGRDAARDDASEGASEDARAAVTAASPTPGADAATQPSPAPATEAWMTGKARTATSADGTYVVAWEPIGGVIPDAEPFAIAIEVRRADGAPLPARAVVAADAEMPHHGHGMNLVPSVRPHPSGAGRFVAEGMLLHMSGRWVLAIDVEEDGVAERTQWYVDVE